MNRKVSHLKPGIPAHEGQLILQRRHRIVLSAKTGSSTTGQAKLWGRLLDIGCGNGAQTALFVPESDQTVGLDIFALDKAQGVISDKRFQFVCGSALTLPFQSDSFDHIMAYEVLEHLPDDRKAVAEIGRVLREDGLFIFSVPN
ncbi:MAG: class I SAM-dependent methyltransferase [Candidatus Electryoneaceae bacterium]|nr:class I SAM-dependent methyltransferase [Candidatus Electryoneaceae bacterium]